MAFVKNTSEVKLPYWFTKERYLRIKKSPIDVLDDELFLRRFLNKESKDGNFDEPEYEELFDKRSLSYETKTTNCYSFSDDNVKELLTFDVIRIVENLRDNGVDLSLSDASFDDICKPIHLTSAVQANESIDGAGLFVGISLSHATDGEILEELSRLLKKARQELYEKKLLKRKKPLRFNLQEMYDNLFYWPVFEYLDLSIWARTKGIRLSRTYYREAFDLLRYKKFEPHQISCSIKRNTEHAISYEFAEQLKRLMKNHKKVHNFNPS